MQVTVNDPPEDNYKESVIEQPELQSIENMGNINRGDNFKNLDETSEIEKHLVDVLITLKINH